LVVCEPLIVSIIAPSHEPCSFWIHFSDLSTITYVIIEI
jgi:hypothetical protein